MMKQTLSLTSLTQILSEAAAVADEQLYRDYAYALSKMKDEGLVPPSFHPLRISGMSVSFSGQAEDCGGDLMLDFSKPDGNFKGEIHFSPHII